MKFSKLEQIIHSNLILLEQERKIVYMTRKERQKANGIGSQKNANGHNRNEREQRFKPLKKREDVKGVSLTEKLGIKNIDK